MLDARYCAGMVVGQPAGEGAWDEALASLPPNDAERLRSIVEDGAYVEPRVVSHARRSLALEPG